MSILRILVIFSVFSLTSLQAFAGGAKAHEFIDQKDSFFINNKIIPSRQESSLCGPVTFMNWLILEKGLSRHDALDLLKKINSEKSGGINHGHTIDQLVEFMGRAEERLAEGLHDRNFYDSKIYGQVRSGDILDHGVQILLVKFNKLKKRAFNRFETDMPYDIGMNEDYPNSPFLHFVLKLPRGNDQIELVDPEQPQRRIIIGIKEESGKVLLSEERYQYFTYLGFTEAYEAQVIGLISRGD